MVRTVRDVIVTALGKLEKKPLKRFRNKLNDWPVKEGYTNIPLSDLEDADAEDITNLIRRFYTDSYGIEVTMAVLDAINEKKAAEELQKDLENVKGFKAQSKESGPGASSKCEQKESTGSKPSVVCVEPQEHFVIKHQVELINRTSLVSPILDVLLANRLLEVEAYNTIRSKKDSPQEQMRELYGFVRTWGDKNKDIVYEALKKYNKPLIQDLEES